MVWEDGKSNFASYPMLFEPDELAHLGGAALSPMAVYSIGFFLFWSLCALASMLTCYLILVPAGDHPPF